VARDSPTTADRLLRDLDARVSTLARYPERGRQVPEIAVYGIEGFRELLIGPYRFVYKVASATVYILAVVDGRRDFVELLAEIVARAAVPIT
jgi:plasmid stabilization system protein ParE